MLRNIPVDCFSDARHSDSEVPKGGYEDIAEAKSAIIDYIWNYYQTVRPHSFNDYLPPAEKERRYFNQNLLLAVLN